ncbi:MAG: hypothetical protein II038_09690 [Lachnospiraceae bacterium]|nr:hypothetical protein [Lachnospiraceae bacterium]
MMYEVEVKCGHVGRNYYTVKTVPVIAESGMEAAERARMMPRVKHDHPDAIRQVRVVDAARFFELVNVHREDPYFRCHSIQEQNQLCPDLEILREERRDSTTWKKEAHSTRTYYDGKQRIRNPKKYMKYYDISEDKAA